MNKKAIREKFRNEVFRRDHHKCVMCGEKAIDAHHIMDRSLFPNGGYVIDNGVSLCPKDHIKAEKNEISCEQLRKKAGIIVRILSPGLDESKEYDKWGNEIKKESL